MLREQEFAAVARRLERRCTKLNNSRQTGRSSTALCALEQQTKRLEQLAGKLETESTLRYNQVRETSMLKCQNKQIAISSA